MKVAKKRSGRGGAREGAGRKPTEMPRDVETLAREDLCKDCHVEAPEDGKSRCETCRVKRNKRERVNRAERRAKHQCLTCGGQVKRDRATVDRPARVYRYCAKHLEYYAARAR